ncbi:MAG: hypothetical protein U0Y68_04450 [Blastocatellia bacterium]
MRRITTQRPSASPGSADNKAEADSLREALRLHLLAGNHDEAAYACEQLIGLARLKRDAEKESEHTITLAMIEAQRDNLPSAFQLLLKAFPVAPQNDAQIKAGRRSSLVR